VNWGTRKFLLPPVLPAAAPAVVAAAHRVAVGNLEFTMQELYGGTP